jgi:hypothetical protein
LCLACQSDEAKTQDLLPRENHQFALPRWQFRGVDAAIAEITDSPFNFREVLGGDVLLVPEHDDIGLSCGKRPGHGNHEAIAGPKRSGDMAME